MPFRKIIGDVIWNNRGYFFRNLLKSTASLFTALSTENGQRHECLYYISSFGNQRKLFDPIVMVDKARMSNTIYICFND